MVPRAFVLLLAAFLFAPKLMAAPDFSTAWTTLGIAETATEADIKTAFRALAKKYSPNVAGVSKEDAAYFPFITTAKDVLLENEYAPIYARMVMLARRANNPPMAINELAGLAPNAWKRLSAQLEHAESDLKAKEAQKQADDAREKARQQARQQAEEAKKRADEARRQAEEARRNPPAEDKIEFQHILMGSAAEKRFVTMFTEKALQFAAELSEYVQTKREESSETQVIHLRRKFVKDVSSWIDDVELSIDGKRIIFSEPFTEAMFRENLKHRLMKEGFLKATVPLEYVQHSEGQSAYSVFGRRFLESISRSRIERLAILVTLYRTRLGRPQQDEYMKRQDEYKIAEEKPLEWTAQAASNIPYLINNLPNTPARKEFMQFMATFANSLPKPVITANSPLQVVTGFAKMGYICAAFAAHGGYPIVENYRASRKIRSEANEK